MKIRIRDGRALIALDPEQLKLDLDDEQKLRLALWLIAGVVRRLGVGEIELLLEPDSRDPHEGS